MTTPDRKQLIAIVEGMARARTSLDYEHQDDLLDRWLEAYVRPRQAAAWGEGLRHGIAAIVTKGDTNNLGPNPYEPKGSS